MSHAKESAGKIAERKCSFEGFQWSAPVLGRSKAEQVQRNRHSGGIAVSGHCCARGRAHSCKKKTRRSASRDALLISALFLQLLIQVLSGLKMLQIGRASGRERV